MNRGSRLADAALEGARLRLRPILMTSFAFLLGVLPLAFSTGAGAVARQIMGTAVMGGTTAASVIAIFLIPVTFYVVAKTLRPRQERRNVEKRGRRPCVMFSFHSLLAFTFSAAWWVQTTGVLRLRRPPSWRFEEKEAREVANTAWWEQFDDPVLNELIQVALKENKDIKIAAARVEEFMGRYGTTRAALFPQVSAGASGGRSRVTEKSPATPYPSLSVRESGRTAFRSS